jgi:hypothetical protein
MKIKKKKTYSVVEDDTIKEPKMHFLLKVVFFLSILGTLLSLTA